MSKIVPGENDIITKFPFVKEFWDYENNTEDPTTLGSSSKQKAWFKCNNGHQFSKTIRSFLATQKCPECDLAKNSIVAAKPQIVDWWDNEKNGDDRPERHYKTDSTVVWWKCPKCGYSWQSEIASRRAGKDLCLCCDLGIAIKIGVNDALTKCPDIEKDWNFAKNTKHPSECFITSNEDVFWKCHHCGYEWKGALSIHVARLPDGSYTVRKCWHCAKKTGMAGDADSFMKKYSEMAEEYVPEMNVLPLDSLLPSSNKLITWRCKVCQQIYKSSPNSRIRSMKGCPYCDHKLPIKGQNDFRTWCEHNFRQDLLDDWDYKRNKHLPEDYYYASGKSVHWRCKNNPEHIWDAKILDRINNRGKCPCCFEEKERRKFAVAHAELMEYWDQEKNIVDPYSVNEFSNENVYWTCKEGHSFQTPIFRMSQKGFYCPICKNYRLFPGINDLVSLYPKLAKEWDFALNQKPPENFRSNSNETVYWICPEGHSSYQRTIRERVLEPAKGCPVCMKTKVVVGINDAKTYYPEIDDVWDYAANDKKPEDIHFEYTKKVNFVCNELGHHWSEPFSQAANRGFKCPYCENRLPLIGFNTLADLYPELAENWDYGDTVYNKSRTPESVVTTMPGALYAWKCSECGNTLRKYSSAYQWRTRMSILQKHTD